MIRRSPGLETAVARWLSVEEIRKQQRMRRETVIQAMLSGALPYEKFADMIERHWEGIAAYCKPENKVALGFVEGLNNKIRVLQRRSYGLRNEEYLRLKILTCMLAEI